MTDIDLMPAPVPALSDNWIAERRRLLTSALPPRRRTALRASAAVGATGLATGIATVVISLGTTVPSAFAGWTSAPTAPGPGQVADATAACQGSFNLAQSKLAAGAVAKEEPSSNVTTDLTDTRGPFTVVVFSNSANTIMCLSEPDATALRVIARPTAAPVPTSSSIVVDNLSFGARDDQDYTVAEGRVGSSVTTVGLTLSDGSTVETTTGDGFFVAWWPGTQGITSATVSTASGTTTQSLGLPGPTASVPDKFAPDGDGAPVAPDGGD